MIKRILKLNVPVGKSLFIWGARQSGKSTYLKQIYPDNFRIDLLKHDVFMTYLQKPETLREEVLSIMDQSKFPIIIDEVQKVPALLDEVHWLIENKKGVSFILCGSSMRRLKHEGSNLLGGRAWTQTFLPLCYLELPKFDLLKILNFGLLPEHYLLEDDTARSLKSYISSYLIPEIQWESRIRKLTAFTRFLEAIAFSNGELLNSSNIARESGVSVKTVQSYIDLLVEMHLGYMIFPYARSKSRQLISSHPKFYFFDTGIVRLLKNVSKFETLKGSEVGHGFEHYIFLEILAFKEINRLDFDIQFWRSKSGLEVDFILAKGRVAIECKISPFIEKSDIKGIVEFSKENKPLKSIVVSLVQNKRIMTFDDVTIEVYPIQEFLKELWDKQIITE
jgi:predicted AAA+ superfamily ATPase